MKITNAWKGKAAIEKMTDQAMLAKVTLEANDRAVRYTAEEKSFQGRDGRTKTNKNLYFHEKNQFIKGGLK